MNVMNTACCFSVVIAVLTVIEREARNNVSLSLEMVAKDAPTHQLVSVTQ